MILLSAAPLNNLRNIPVLLLPTLLLLPSLGCQNPGQEPLTALFEQIDEHVTSKLRPEITELPREQRSITLFRDQCRDECDVIDRFLQTNPKLSADSKQIVLDYRDASNNAAEYYDSFIKAKNYELKDSESQRGRQLLDLVLVKMGDLAKIVDGKK